MHVNNVLIVDGLRQNLLSTSQLCDSGKNVDFDKEHWTIYHNNGTKMFAFNRQGNIYKIDMDELSNQKVTMAQKVWSR